MPIQPEQDEDNWDDDFEFGSSAGSPVLGAQKRVNGTITPENPSHLDTGQRRNATSLDFQTEKGRWSSGSFEDWDAEDETINAKGFASLQQTQQPSMSRQGSSNHLPRMPVRTPKISSCELRWSDEEDDTDATRSAGVVATFPSTAFVTGPLAVNSVFSFTPSSEAPPATPSAISPFPSQPLSPSNSKSPFPSMFANSNESATDSTNPDFLDHPSDTSASASQAGSFLGRLGRRFSKAGTKSPTATLSPATTDNDLHSSLASSLFTPLTSATLSPPVSSGNLSASTGNEKQALGHSPSKSRVLMFGSNVLKRSGSLGRSGNSKGHQRSETVATVKQPKKSSAFPPDAEPALSNGTRFGMELYMPMNEGHTDPPDFNAVEYAQRAAPPLTSHMQYSSHVHSQSMAGLGMNSWSTPPSPTGGKGKQDVQMLDIASSSKRGPRMRFLSGSEGRDDNAKPANQSSFSTSGAFFSSLKKRSNQLQASNRVPSSAMTGTPPTSATSSQSQSQPLQTQISSHSPAMEQGQIFSPNQGSLQVQTQGQRQRRSHRRNISTGAMITSVIDEVSSDATVTNKLSAVQGRDRTSQKSNLRETTTASEIRHLIAPSDLKKGDGFSRESARLSISSDRSNTSLPRAVSPVEFSHTNEDSTAAERFALNPPAFTFPPPKDDDPTSSSQNGAEPEGDKAFASGDKQSTTSSLLPPIELCPLPPGARILKPSPKNRNMVLKQEVSSSSSSSLTDHDIDQDKTPLAAPRRRPPALGSGDANSLAPHVGKDDVFNVGLTSSISAPVSVSSVTSSRTLASGSGKQGTVGIRGSTGISASLGRAAGSTTAEKIDGPPSEMPGDKVTRRNSLTGGTVPATTSITGSFSGGLKIPAHIIAKQEAMKRDLNAVREFAHSIEDLKRLRVSYEMTLNAIASLSKTTPNSLPSEQFDNSPSKRLYRMRAISPTMQFHIPRPPSTVAIDSQPTSPTSARFDATFLDSRVSHPLLFADFEPERRLDVATWIPQEDKDKARSSIARLDSQYAIWWECADLLIELGSASPPTIAGTPIKPPTMSSLQKVSTTNKYSPPRLKDKHATLPRHGLPHHSAHSLSSTSLDPSTSSSEPSVSSPQRRGSTGQQDLNARQIQLLKGMLTTPNPNDLSSSVGFHACHAPPSSALSPIISYPSSSMRSANNLDWPDFPQRPLETTTSEDAVDEKEKRRRRVSLAGKLSVKEILASLKRTKEKVMKQKVRQQPTIIDDRERTSLDRTGIESRGSMDHSRSTSQAPPSPHPGVSRESLGVVAPTKANNSPSPFKRNRRKSLASIFKFGGFSTSQTEDKMVDYSQSRIDLASPTPGDCPSKPFGDRMGADGGSNTDTESDWDHMNSPSDMPGRYKTSQSSISLIQDLSSSAIADRGRSALVGAPTRQSSIRYGSSTVSRNASTSRCVCDSASVSAASLISSSVMGSATSQQSLHEALGGGAAVDRNNEEKTRLKKPVKMSRRPPVSRHRSAHTSSQSSLPAYIANSIATSPTISPIIDGTCASGHDPSYHQVQTTSGQSGSSHFTMQSRRPPNSVDWTAPRLALTPESIIPLLVYAREVKLKVQECIEESRSVEKGLLAARMDDDYSFETAPSAMEGGKYW